MEVAAIARTITDFLAHGEYTKAEIIEHCSHCGSTAEIAWAFATLERTARIHYLPSVGLYQIGEPIDEDDGNLILDGI